MKHYRKVIDILNLMEETSSIIEAQFPSEGSTKNADLCLVWENLKLLSNEVNLEVFFSRNIIINDLSSFLDKPYSGEEKDVFLSELNGWISMIRSVIAQRESCTNFIDRSFYTYMDRIKYVSYDILREQIIDALYKNDPRDIAHMEYFYEVFGGFWGTLNTVENNFEVIEKRLKSLKENRDDFIVLYERLCDYRSKYVLLKDIEYWFTYNMKQTVLTMKEYAFRDYFDMDILHCDKNEVIVDLGAFTGDSILDYSEVYEDYKKVFCFEVSPWNAGEIQKTLDGFHDIHIIQKAAGDVSGKTHMYIAPAVDSSNSDSIKKGYDMEVDVVTVDDEIKEPVTLIKMDIEGFEQRALKGCREHIINDHPKLLICVYHNNEDIVKIPRMILDIRDDYDLYLRSNGDQYGPSEIVLFAIPKKTDAAQILS